MPLLEVKNLKIHFLVKPGRAVASSRFFSRLYGISRRASVGP